MLVNRGFDERRFSSVVNDDRESVRLVLDHLTWSMRRSQRSMPTEEMSRQAALLFIEHLRARLGSAHARADAIAHRTRAHRCRSLALSLGWTAQ